MLRAVGLRRASLVGAFAAEGWCYAVRVRDRGNVRRARARARLIMAAAAKLFSRPRRRLAASRCTSRSSGRACSADSSIGFVIAIATVVITSVWLSRFNIIQAIRDITEPAGRKPHRALELPRHRRSPVVGLLLTGVGVVGVVVPRAVARTGPRVPRHRAHARAPVPAASSTPRSARSCSRGRSRRFRSRWLDIAVDVLLFVVQGLVLVGAAVVLTAQHQQRSATGSAASPSDRCRRGLRPLLCQPQLQDRGGCAVVPRIRTRGGGSCW